MSIINKPPNRPASSNVPTGNSSYSVSVPNRSSFTTVMNNGIKNVSKSLLSPLPESVSEPINEFINNSIQENESTFTSSFIIMILGFCVLAFILIIIFREQLAIAFEFVIHKIRSAFQESSASTPPPAMNVPSDPEPSSAPSAPPTIIEKILPGKKEVFNIAQDKYTYTDAEPLCKAFGAELATYDQVKDAWNKGADWCNYGWIKGQSAVYPTQKETYQKLQAGPEAQRGSCGIPGVNGGYFDNPELRFGVNCYGAKPSETDTDDRNKAAERGGLAPGALEYDKKVQDYKTNLNQVPVNPFSTGTWSA